MECLAEVERCPLKPLAYHFYATIELSYLCNLHTHKGKQYIHVDLHKLIQFREGVSFYRFTTLVETHLKFMSDILWKFAWRSTKCIKGFISRTIGTRLLPTMLMCLIKSLSYLGSCSTNLSFAFPLWFHMLANLNAKNWRGEIL